MIKGIYNYDKYDDEAIEWFLGYTDVETIIDKEKRVIVFPDIEEEDLLCVLMKCPDKYLFAIRRLTLWIYQFLTHEVDYE